MFGSNCDVMRPRLNGGSNKTRPGVARAAKLSLAIWQDHALEREDRQIQYRVRFSNCPESHETCAKSQSQRTSTLLGDVVRCNFIITYSTLQLVPYVREDNLPIYE